MQLTKAGAVPPDAADAARAPLAAVADARRRTVAGRWKMLALLLVCAAPVIASYFTYYVIRPEGRTNYGTLLEPLRDVGALGARVAGAGAPAVAADAGSAGGIASLRGRWIMLVVAPGDCDAGCRERLYIVRQVRLTTGKDRDRVERVWLMPDAAMPDPALLAQHEGLVLMRARADTIARELPATPDTKAADHVYLIDPLGNLMMRYPNKPDPTRMKKDLAKLLRASRVG